MVSQRLALFGVCIFLAAVLGIAFFWLDPIGAPVAISGDASLVSNIQQSPTASPDSAATVYLYLALVLLALGVILSIAVTFYLYRWRRILLANPHMLLPEEFGAYLQRIDLSLDQLSDSVVKSDGASQHRLAAIKQDCSAIEKSIREFQQAFASLQAELDSKDGEIKRLKNGYDAQVFKRFLQRFTKVDQALYDALRGELNASDVEHVQSVLHDAFAECDLERFEPPNGTEYRSATGVAENPEIVPSGHGMKAGQVIKTLDPGYRLRRGESFETIVPARVAIAG